MFGVFWGVMGKWSGNVREVFGNCLGSVWEVFGNVSECFGVFGSVWDHFISAAQQWSIFKMGPGEWAPNDIPPSQPASQPEQHQAVGFSVRKRA